MWHTWKKSQKEFSDKAILKNKWKWYGSFIQARDQLRGLVERGLGCPCFGRPVIRLSLTDLAADHRGTGEFHWDQREHSSEPIPKGQRIESWASWMVVSSGEVRYTPNANRYILTLEQHRSELHGSTYTDFFQWMRTPGLQVCSWLNPQMQMGGCRECWL